jgi:hypothetical protein
MKPILFSPPMVQAILEGRKTMTRRTLKDIPTEGLVYDSSEKSRRVHGPYHGFNQTNFSTPNCFSEYFKCPYGQAGDILWVKEAYFAFGHWEQEGTTKKGKDKWNFVYDSQKVVFNEDEIDSGFYFESKYTGYNHLEPRWFKRNSLFMPLWASRIQLEITKVRCERLLDITEEDAKNEGVTLDGPVSYIPACQKSPYVYHFAYLWDTINGYGSFEKNPWVWVIEFRRVK